MRFATLTAMWGGWLLRATLACAQGPKGLDDIADGAIHVGVSRHVLP